MSALADVWERFKSPLRGPYHYFLFRAEALRLGFEERRKRAAGGDDPPLPPPLLRHRVNGTLDAGVHREVGRICSRNIRDLLGLIGKDLSSFEHVLDFGCGSGRVLGYLRDRPASCHLYGTDIDGEAISWCREHLPFARWDTNGALPPMRYADATFDFVYAISVFTHLDERMQFAWLEELKRVSKPGAILLLSVHGAAALSQWPEGERALASEKGFYYKVVRKGLFDRDGTPHFYQATQHSREYVEANWSRLFEVLRYVEAGINGHQDAVILRNR